MKIKNPIISFIYNKIFIKLIPDVICEIENEIKNCENILDVGCGSTGPMRHINKKIYSVGIDLFEPYIEESRSLKIHNEYHLMDILKIGENFKNNSFDCVIASDVIEHLEKEDGLSLLKQMEKIAKKKVIIFTPNGFVKQGIYESNPWQIHRSGRTVKEMKNMGYRVIGINGLKLLKGEHGRLVLRPVFFRSLISRISQLLVRNHPENAFAILCIKEKVD